MADPKDPIDIERMMADDRRAQQFVREHPKLFKKKAASQGLPSPVAPQPEPDGEVVPGAFTAKVTVTLVEKIAREIAGEDLWRFLKDDENRRPYLAAARGVIALIEAEGFRIMSEGDIKKVYDEGVQEGLLDH